MLPARGHVSGGRLHLRRDLRGQPESPGGVLPVDDHKVGGHLVLEARQDRFDGISPGMPHHISDKQDAKFVRHQVSLERSQSGVPAKSKISWGGNKMRNASATFRPA